MKTAIFRMFGASGEQRIRALLWCIVIIQLILWLSEYWLHETTQAAIYSVIAALVVEWAIPRIRIKPLIQALAVVLANGWLFSERRSDGETGIFSAIINSHPYIWYALSAAVVFMCVQAWANTKPRAIYILLLSLSALCIVDSFSLIVLWDHIVIIILCGLLLVSLLHFSEFRRKYPSSWSKLKQNPGTIIIPLVVLFTVMLFAGLQAPALQPFLTDPYTAWKNAQGEKVAKRGKPLEPSVQYISSSGYSRDNTQLGGSFLYDHSTVMTVWSTKRAYWRGETLSYYDGKGWRQGPPMSVILPQGKSDTEMFDTSKLQTEEIEHTVTMTKDEEYRILFAAYKPERIVSIEEKDSSWSDLYWEHEHNEIRWLKRSITTYDGHVVENNRYPKSYTIISQVPILDEEGLRDAYSSVAPAGVVDEKYVQLPSHLPDRVKELATEITDGTGTVYDQVKQIETYLKTEFAYTNTPDESKANSEDFVDRFLFEVQEGYCDYFSTAMVVMLRSLDIPARWVKGFTPGDSDAASSWEDYFTGRAPEGPATYTVRNSNAHSWVEVYFPGYGWIPFEPTPGHSFSYGIDEAQDVMAPLPKETPDESVSSETETDESEKSPFRLNTSWLPAFIVIAGVLVVVGYALLRNDRLKHWRVFTFRKMNEDESLIYVVQRLLAFAAKKGMPRAEHETMREWVKRWGSNYRWLNDDLQQLLTLFEKARYQPAQITAEEIGQTKQIAKRLRKQIRAARKQSML